MKLYISPTSPFARKARILAREKGLHVDEIEVNPWDSPLELLARNPLCKIPVLELADGSTLFDSRVIVEYLDGLAGAPLLPPSGKSRWAVLRWQALADGMTEAGVLRFKETQRPAAQRSPEWIARQGEAIERVLRLAGGAERGQAYLVDDRFSLADVALGVALDYLDLRYRHDWRGEYPWLALWHAGISARPAFAATVPPGLR